MGGLSLKHNKRILKVDIKWEKSTFAEKNLKLLYGPIFPILWEKYFFSSKTSSDRLKLIYKTKKMKKK
jgi:hypothetical protein